MIEVKVTVEMPGIPEAINNLAAAIANGSKSAVPATAVSAPVMNTIPAVNVIPAVEPVTTMPTVTTLPVAPPVVTTAPVAESAPTTGVAVTLDDISRVGAELVDGGKMADLIGLLKNYGVPAITQLKEDQLQGFAAGLRAIGGKI